MPKNPYEWLYERQRQPLKEYVLDEVSKRLAQTAQEFPPAIEEWERDAQRQRFEPLLARARGRPREEVLRCALKLYRWELRRDHDAIDHYMRGGHHAALGLSSDELETAIFLWQNWYEQTLAFKEYVQEKFLWSELAALAERLEARLLGGAPP